MDDDERAKAMQALSEAEAVCEGQSRLSNAIGVRQSTVSQWRKRGRIPAEHCPSIERETRLRGRPIVCERLCPKVDWKEVRAHAVTEQQLPPREGESA